MWIHVAFVAMVSWLVYTHLQMGVKLGPSYAFPPYPETGGSFSDHTTMNHTRDKEARATFLAEIDQRVRVSDILVSYVVDSPWCGYDCHLAKQHRLRLYCNTNGAIDRNMMYNTFPMFPTGYGVSDAQKWDALAESLSPDRCWIEYDLAWCNTTVQRLHDDMWNHNAGLLYDRVDTVCSQARIQHAYLASNIANATRLLDVLASMHTEQMDRVPEDLKGYIVALNDFKPSAAKRIKIPTWNGKSQIFATCGGTVTMSGERNIETLVGRVLFGMEVMTSFVKYHTYELYAMVIKARSRRLVAEGYEEEDNDDDEHDTQYTRQDDSTNEEEDNDDDEHDIKYTHQDESTNEECEQGDEENPDRIKQKMALGRLFHAMGAINQGVEDLIQASIGVEEYTKRIRRDETTRDALVRVSIAIVGLERHLRNTWTLIERTEILLE